MNKIYELMNNILNISKATQVISFDKNITIEFWRISNDRIGSCFYIENINICKSINISEYADMKEIYMYINEDVLIIQLQKRYIRIL
jgi:hypothetical protein